MSIKIYKEHCTGCNYCTVICPADAITLQIEQRAWPQIDNQKCISCGECIYVCPNNVFSSKELISPPVDLESYYDVIIIGAGIGGLMTAAGLVQAGKKVLILEQLSFIGGKYTHFSRGGYAISTAAWTCPGPNSRIGRLCTKLGAGIEWRTIHDTKARGDHWVLQKKGKQVIPFKSTDHAQETLVGGSKGMALVYQWIADMYDPDVTYPDNMTAREYIEKYFPGNEDYVKYVETIITYCFASQTVDTFSANETKRAIVDALEQMADWGTAVGGTAAIVQGLEKVIRQYNGKIATRTKVKSIILENSTATGVMLEDGRRINAEIVIHNAGLNRFIQLVGEQNLPVDYVAHLRSAVPANVAALILGTRQPLLREDHVTGNPSSSLKVDHSLLHTMGFERTLNCYAPTFFDPKLAPEDKHALDVFWVMEPPYNMKEELAIVRNELRQVFAHYDEMVEMEIPMFFTGMWTAEMAHRLGQSGDQRLDPLSPINNLFLVGYDCIGYGMAGDIIPHGVERVLYHLLKDKKYAPESENKSILKRNKNKSRLFKLMAGLKRIFG